MEIYSKLYEQVKERPLEYIKNVEDNFVKDIPKALATIGFCIENNLNIYNKSRFIKLITATLHRDPAISSKSMEIISIFLNIGKLDDFEKKYLYDHITQKFKKDIFYKIRYSWIISIALECSYIYREHFVAGIIGFFHGNSYINSHCDCNIRGLKVFMEQIVMYHGRLNINKYFDKIKEFNIFLGYPHKLVTACFIGFSHIKYNSLDTVEIIKNMCQKQDYSEYETESNIILANAIRYCLKTSDLSFDTFSFIESISENISIDFYLELKLLNDKLNATIDDDVYKFKPLLNALYAFCKSPNNFNDAIAICKNNNNIESSIIGMLIGCRQGIIKYNSIYWNGDDIFYQMNEYAESFFSIANNSKIICS